MKTNRLRPVDLAKAIPSPRTKGQLTKAAASSILSGRSSPDPETRIAIEAWTSGAVHRAGWDDTQEAAILRRVVPHVAAPTVQP